MSVILFGYGAGGGIQFVDEINSGTTEFDPATDTIDLTALSGVQEGDVLLLIHGAGTTTNITMTVSSSGWTKNPSPDLYANDTDDANLGMWWKTMGATPDTTIQIANHGWSSSWIVAAFREVNPTSPISIQTDTGINTILPNPPSITPTVPGSLIFVAGCGASQEGVETFGQSEMDQFFTCGEGGTSPARSTTLGFGFRRWDGGAFNPAQFTCSAAGNTGNSWCAITGALAPK